MIYLGIDPGKRGAVAYMMETPGGNFVTNAVPMEQALFTLKALASTGKPIRACIEKVHAMPKQGVTSTFTFGAGYGWLKGVMDALGISYQEIPPEKWKKEFGLNTDKQKSIAVCRQLFPEADLRPSERSRVDNDGMAEALLMAEYARRKL
jgi:crossover junction endodeoxyribonuclease RuvC